MRTYLRTFGFNDLLMGNTVCYGMVGLNKTYKTIKYIFSLLTITI